MHDYVSYLSKKQEFLIRCGTKYLFSHNFQNPSNPCQGILMPRLGLLTTKHQAVRAGYGVADDATGSEIAWAMISTPLFAIDPKNRTVKGLHLLQCVIYIKIFSGRQDSNLRHPAPKAGALPG